MRDVLFRNTVSQDRKRRLVASSETIDKNGMRTVIHRHFICMAQEISKSAMEKPRSQVYVVKSRNTKLATEDFLCKVKGALFVKRNSRMFFVRFVHSLRIHLCTVL